MSGGPRKPELTLLEGGDEARTQELALPTSSYGRFAAYFLSRGKNGPSEATTYIKTVLNRGETVITIPGDTGHILISHLVTFFETSDFLDTEAIRELRKMLGEAEQESEAGAVAAAREFATQDIEGQLPESGTNPRYRFMTPKGTIMGSMSAGTLTVVTPLDDFESNPTGEWSQTAPAATPSIDTGDGPFRSGTTGEIVSQPPTAAPAPTATAEPATISVPLARVVPSAMPDPKALPIVTAAATTAPVVPATAESRPEPEANSQTYQDLKEAIEEASLQKGFRYNGVTEVVNDYNFETDAEGTPLLAKAEKKKIEVRTGVSLLEAIFTAAQEHKITSAERTALATKCTTKMVREGDFFVTRDLLNCLSEKLTTREELRPIIEAAQKIDPAFIALGDRGEELLSAIGLEATAAPKTAVEQVEISGEEDPVFRIRRGLWIAGGTLTLALVAGGVALALRGQRSSAEDQVAIAARPAAAAPSSAPKPKQAPAAKKPTAPKKTAPPKPAAATVTPQPAATPAPQAPAAPKPPAATPAPVKVESAPNTVTLAIKLTPENTIDPASAEAWQKDGWQISQQMVGVDPVAYSFTLKRKGQTLVIPGNTFAPGQTSIVLPIQ